jgi:hypothetical protein
VKQKIEVRHKGLTLRISPSTSIKKGVAYKCYRVVDYSSGKRKLWTFADVEDAKSKAKEIADATAAGQKSLLVLALLEREIRAALDLVAVTGTRIDHAAMIFAEAVKLVPADEIVTACRAWRETREGRSRLRTLYMNSASVKREGFHLVAAGPTHHI